VKRIGRPGRRAVNASASARAAALRHHDIGHDDIHARPGAIEHFQRRSHALGLEHLIPGARQRDIGQPAHRLLVFDHEHRLAMAARGHGRGLRRDVHVDHCGQPDRERRAAGGRVEVDESAVLVDDALHHRQPQSRAVSQVFGGEEGLEDP
jgi:hypothetical protein